MPEDLGSRPPQPRAEQELPQTAVRNVAVDYGEYFAIYQLGRGEYDRASSRIPELDRMRTAAPPSLRDRIELLDAHLERAQEIRKGMFTDLVPSGQTDPEESMETGARFYERTSPDLSDVQRRSLPRGILRLVGKTDRNAPSGQPPDYTFSSVRHPIARPLLNLLNIAMVVDDEIVNDPARRSRLLQENGKKIVKELTGDDPQTLLRVRVVDVLTAVFDGRIKLPDSPGKSLLANTEIRVGADEIPEGIDGTPDES